MILHDCYRMSFFCYVSDKVVSFNDSIFMHNYGCLMHQLTVQSIFSFT